jgi:hypothetical protein
MSMTSAAPAEVQDSEMDPLWDSFINKHADLVDAIAARDALVPNTLSSSHCADHKQETSTCPICSLYSVSATMSIGWPNLQDTLLLRQCLEAALLIMQMFQVPVRIDTIPDLAYATTMYGVHPMLEETAVALWENGVQASQLASMEYGSRLYP